MGFASVLSWTSPATGSAVRSGMMAESGLYVAVTASAWCCSPGSPDVERNPSAERMPASGTLPS